MLVVGTVSTKAEAEEIDKIAKLFAVGLRAQELSHSLTGKGE